MINVHEDYRVFLQSVQKNSYFVLLIGLYFVPGFRVVLAIPSEGEKRKEKSGPPTSLHNRENMDLSTTTKQNFMYSAGTYETSGFFKASRHKYVTLMVAPPPMKMKRGIS